MAGVSPSNAELEKFRRCLGGQDNRRYDACVDRRIPEPLTLRMADAVRPAIQSIAVDRSQAVTSVDVYACAVESRG